MIIQIVISIDIILFFIGVSLAIIGIILDETTSFSFPHYLTVIGGVLFILSLIISLFIFCLYLLCLLWR